MKNHEKKSHSSCRYKRQLYIAKKAQADYEALLVESRTGIPLNKERAFIKRNVLSPMQFAKGSIFTMWLNLTIYLFQLLLFTVT